MTAVANAAGSGGGEGAGSGAGRGKDIGREANGPGGLFAALGALAASPRAAVVRPLAQTCAAVFAAGKTVRDRVKEACVAFQVESERLYPERFYYRHLRLGKLGKHGKAAPKAGGGMDVPGAGGSGKVHTTAMVEAAPLIFADRK